MKTLREVARAAQSQNQEPVEEYGPWFDRVSARRARLHQYLAGFDHEIEAVTEYCFAVGIRHPHRKEAWLAFVVNEFNGGDEPIFPAQGREIRIRAGQVFERSVYLPLAAAEYMVQNEQE